MREEREAFEKIIKEVFRDYLHQNMGCLLKGNVRIEDDGKVIRVYRKCNEVLDVPRYDIGIVY